MTDVATRRREGLREMRRLDWAWRFEEDGREDRAFHKTKPIGSERFSRHPVEVPCGTLDGKHGALAKKGFNAHDRFALVYSINYLAQDKSIVDRVLRPLHYRSEVPSP